MTFSFPSHIKSDFQGYSVLVRLFQETRELRSDKLILHFYGTQWFEANLCAGLGAILSSIQGAGNEIEFKGHANIQSILSKNGFLAQFGGWKKRDYYSTTIQYRQFDATKIKGFNEYLDRELLAKEDLPRMSELLKKKINKSIYEIFNNCYLHGNCDTAFSCGQYYPTKKRLDFTIADLGHSIRKNVRDFLGNSKLSGAMAIRWAIEEGNTTRSGNIPGGLGFSLIREFLLMNQGKLQIVSSDGYYEVRRGVESVKSFDHTFVGTLVNMEFNINDKYSYALSSEIDVKDIF
ncbi:hypothetical protein [Ekhidna sp.]|uniref:hypothetical protein n=1 Tax=Ekhidna sp. TaxID=2608089 RepID=UPI003B5AC751